MFNRNPVVIYLNQLDALCKQRELEAIKYRTKQHTSGRYCIEAYRLDINDNEIIIGYY